MPRCSTTPQVDCGSFEWSSDCGSSTNGDADSQCDAFRFAETPQKPDAVCLEEQLELDKLDIEMKLARLDESWMDAPPPESPGKRDELPESPGKRDGSACGVGECVVS
jgi:hypothetical protein